MVKPEWGTKRTCPKCATRFYDLGKDDPVTCIELRRRLGARADPEVQAAAAVRGAPKAERAKKPTTTDLGDDDLDIDIESTTRSPRPTTTSISAATTISASKPADDDDEH